MAEPTQQRRDDDLDRNEERPAGQRGGPATDERRGDSGPDLDRGEGGRIAGDGDEQGPGRRSDDQPTPTSMSGSQAVEAAMSHVQQLTGRAPDTISGISRSERGWAVAVEVVELSRIPPSTDVLASYEVEIDGDGDLIEFQRTRRYFRNQADEE